MGKRAEARKIRKAQIEFAMEIIRQGQITRSELTRRLPKNWPASLIIDQISRSRLAYSKAVPLGSPTGGSQRLYSITPFEQPRDTSAFTGRLGLMMGYATIQPRSKGTHYTENDAVPSMPAQSCGMGFGIQSGMNSVYYGG